MATTLVMLPPQTPTTRAWASRLADALPELSVVVAEAERDAARAVGEADAAFGTMPDALLGQARRLRWLQAPQAAPPAGYYTRWRTRWRRGNGSGSWCLPRTPRARPTSRWRCPVASPSTANASG